MILLISRYPTRGGSNKLPPYRLNHGRPGIGDDNGRVALVCVASGLCDGVGEWMKGEDGEVERKRIET